MSVKKTSAVKASTKDKGAATRPASTHPSWIDMIKECITANTEDSRHGVSRPHIKKYVEERYRLQIGNAQNTQLSRAIASGAEKGIFVLPKGPSGRVKLPPKNTKPADASASKENKPVKVTSKVPKVIKKPSTKPATTGASTTKAFGTKSTRPVAKSTRPVSKSTRPVAKSAKPAKPAPVSKAKTAPVSPLKKTLAGKKAPVVKKVTSTSKRGSVKKAVTGTSPRAAAKKSMKKAVPKASIAKKTRK